jgi:hypothetical protein
VSKVIYLSKNILLGINAISELSNDEKILDHLNPIDHHFALFSTLYQSGVNYIQMDKAVLPKSMRDNPFWSKIFIDTDKNIEKKSVIKALSLLKDNFDHDEDKKYTSSQYINLLTFFSDFFYSTETGIPFVNPMYSESGNFKSLESILSKELFHAIDILYKQTIHDNVTGITPQYSAMKSDIRRFNEITESIQYSKYAESLQLLNEHSKIEEIKKYVKSNALILQTKYASQLSLKDIAFSFIKLNKRLLDLFVSKPISIIGDSLISSVENIVKNGNRIFFYKVEEAHYPIQFAIRFEEYRRKVGKEEAMNLLNEFKNNR